MTQRQIAGASFLLVLTLATSASALRHVQWSTRTSRDVAASGVTSGATVTEARLLRPKSKEVDARYGGYPLAAFNTIVVGEVHDKPCYIGFLAGKLDESGELDGSTYTETCNYNPGDTKRAELPSGAFIRGVQVCTNDSDSSPRLKGLKVFGVRFDDDGKPTNLSTAASFELPNCKKWHAAQACATGEVATAIKVYKKEGSVTALGLECRPAYSAQTAPKDYSITVDPTEIPAAAKNSELKIQLHIKNNTAKAIKYFDIALRLNAEKFPDSQCVMKAKGSFEVPANGVLDETLSAFCNWDEVVKAQASCLPGKSCSVPITVEFDWLADSFLQFFLPKFAETTVSISRPGGDPSLQRTAPSAIKK
jgi:hypothetical protein